MSVRAMVETELSYAVDSIVDRLAHEFVPEAEDAKKAERKRCADMVRDVELGMTRSPEDVDTRALLVDLADKMEAGT